MVFEKILLLVKLSSGVIEIKRDAIPDFGSKKLNLYIENGRILQFLDEINECSDISVRTFCNEKILTDSTIIFTITPLQPPAVSARVRGHWGRFRLDSRGAHR